MAHRNELNPRSPYHLLMREREREIVKATLEQFEGHMGQASAALGVSPHYFSKRARALGVSWKEMRHAARSVPAPR